MAEPRPLEFDDRRLLPEGIRDATMDEIDKHFARFQRSDRRIRLFEHLKRYVREVQTAQWKVSLIIDGSFVIAKKGALEWGKPSGAKVQSSWQWQMALVFLSPYPLEVLRRMK